MQIKKFTFSSFPSTCSLKLFSMQKATFYDDAEPESLQGPVNWYFHRDFFVPSCPQVEENE